VRVQLVAHSDTRGGAARAGYRQHCALRASGVDSRLLVRHKHSSDESVEQIGIPGGDLGERLRAKLEREVVGLQRTPDPIPRSANIVPTRLSRRLDADVVDLQWIGSGTMSCADVPRISPPIVMTLHDMWAFCGSEHYAPDGPHERWVDGYARENRPETHRGLDMDRWTWWRKRRWRPDAVVAPSRWLAECASRSRLFRNSPIHVIPYALDLSVFEPSADRRTRQLLRVPDGASVIIFAAVGGIADPRKGFDLLAAALRQLRTDRPAVCVVLGQEPPDEPPDLGLPLRWTGHVEDESRLTDLYNVADVAVVPSRQDNLPQTATEAQACGTPVVAFRTGGLPDALEHRRTGFLADPFSASSLAEGIDWILADDSRRSALGREARERAIRLWSPTRVASQYLDVYDEVVDRRQRGGP
jgi:glycosyltransferase involved in cell wall biosynthesis